MRNWIEICEGRVDKDALLFNPSRIEFLAFLRVCWEKQARCLLIDDNIVVGNAGKWTHHGMAKAAKLSHNKCLDGFLTADQILIWGMADINDFPNEYEDQVEGLFHANKYAYVNVSMSPAIQTLYPTIDKISFTCNDGLMFSIHTDGSKDIEDIDIPLTN